MRLHQWFKLANTFKARLRRGPIEFGFFSCEHARSRVRLLSVIDSRESPADSCGKFCSNHPLIQDTDGLLFDYQGQQVYISYPMICASLTVDLDHGIWSRRHLLDSLPQDIQTAILQHELKVIAADEAGMSDHEFRQTYTVIDQHVQELYPDNMIAKEEAQTVAENGNRQVLAYLEESLNSNEFLLLTSLTEFMNRRAKFVRDRGGNDRPYYELKTRYLRKLLEGWSGRPCHDPETLSISHDNGLLSILTGYRIPVFSQMTMFHQRAFHMPPRDLGPKMLEELLTNAPQLASRLDI